MFVISIIICIFVLRYLKQSIMKNQYYIVNDNIKVCIKRIIINNVSYINILDYKTDGLEITYTYKMNFSKKNIVKILSELFYNYRELVDIKFNDLVFEKISEYSSNCRAYVKFNNGYGISVLKYPTTHYYDSWNGVLECAIFYNDKFIEHELLDFDIVHYRSEDDVNKLIRKIQEL